MTIGWLEHRFVGSYESVGRTGVSLPVGTLCLDELSPPAQDVSVLFIYHKEGRLYFTSFTRITSCVGELTQPDHEQALFLATHSLTNRFIGLLPREYTVCRSSHCRKRFAHSVLQPEHRSTRRERPHESETLGSRTHRNHKTPCLGGPKKNRPLFPTN